MLNELPMALEQDAVTAVNLAMTRNLLITLVQRKIVSLDDADAMIDKSISQLSPGANPDGPQRHADAMKLLEALRGDIHAQCPNLGQAQ